MYGARNPSEHNTKSGMGRDKLVPSVISCKISMHSCLSCFSRHVFPNPKKLCHAKTCFSTSSSLPLPDLVFLSRQHHKRNVSRHAEQLFSTASSWPVCLAFCQTSIHASENGASLWRFFFWGGGTFAAVPELILLIQTWSSPPGTQAMLTSRSLEHIGTGAGPRVCRTEASRLSSPNFYLEIIVRFGVW